VILLLLTSATLAEAAGGLRISNRLSHVNRFRSSRSGTDFIILHTTEGGDRGSLDRIKRRGLAHYVVMRDGRVHRVIKRDKIAIHAGRSMWEGVQNLDRRALGIEVVGYHNKPITDRQVAALKELLRQLQKMYNIPDDHVLTHSMVAYGRPNRWHKKNHRGRKRCGMQFADPTLRRRLGLESRPLYDPDVRAGRLIEADPYLARQLYKPVSAAEQGQHRGPAAEEASGPNVITARRSAWYIAREAYDDRSTVYVFPSGQRKRGDQITDWARLPEGTRVLLDQNEETRVARPSAPLYLTLGRDQAVSRVVGRAYDDYATLYVLPNGRVKRGDTMSETEFRQLPPTTRIFKGFEYAGKVTRRTTAYRLCGVMYNRASTLYLLPGGGIKRGDAINQKRIPPGTLVLVRI
jgi:N-acetylmuramoyl-L-alanine amidase